MGRDCIRNSSAAFACAHQVPAGNSCRQPEALAVSMQMLDRAAQLEHVRTEIERCDAVAGGVAVESRVRQAKTCCQGLALRQHHQFMRALDVIPDMNFATARLSGWRCGH
jgi:hypothetical protein